MKFRKQSYIIVIFILYKICLSQWSTDPSHNTPICTEPNNQLHPQIVVDKNGNSIIAWLDVTSPEGIGQIYAQRLNRYGYKMWDDRGIPIIISTSDKYLDAVIKDGNGGAIIIWSQLDEIAHPEPFEYNIYAQRIDSCGILQWNYEGITICNAEKNQFSIKAISDQNNGAIIVWEDHRPALGGIYSQKVNFDGELLWEINGKLINDASSQGSKPEIVSNGIGGAIISYHTTGPFCQNVNNMGEFLWPTDSIKYNLVALGSRKMIEDGKKGFIIVGRGFDGTNNYNISAQKVDSFGNLCWNENGIIVSDFADNISAPEIISDMQNGAIIFWDNVVAGVDMYKLYLGRVDNYGNSLWMRALNDSGIYRSRIESRHLIGDEKGNAIIKFANLIDSNLQYQIIQKFDTSGNSLWGEQGVTFSTQMNSSAYGDMASDENGGVIIVWTEFPHDIYAQQISANGNLGEIITHIHDRKTKIKLESEFSYCGYPNPFNSVVKIKYRLPISCVVTLEIYNIMGQKIKTLINGKYEAVGFHQAYWNGSNDAGSQTGSGIYICSFRAGKFFASKKLSLMK